MLLSSMLSAPLLGTNADMVGTPYCEECQPEGGFLQHGHVTARGRLTLAPRAGYAAEHAPAIVEAG